jgi:hypothetical protein
MGQTVGKEFLASASATSYPFVDFSDEITTKIADASIYISDTIDNLYLTQFSLDGTIKLATDDDPSYFYSTEGVFQDFGSWRVLSWSGAGILIKIVVSIEDLLLPAFSGSIKFVSRVISNYVTQLSSLKSSTGNIILNAEDHVSIEQNNNRIVINFDNRHLSSSSSTASDGILSINSVKPDSRGNIRLEGDGCYWFKFPYSWDDPSGSSPDPSIPEDLEDNFLQLNNACSACCACEDYAEAYEYIRYVLNRANAVKNAIGVVRYMYEYCIDRYSYEKSQREKVEAFMVVQAIEGGFMNVTTYIANGTPDDYTVNNLKWEFSTYIDIVPASLWIYDDQNQTKRIPVSDMTVSENEITYDPDTTIVGTRNMTISFQVYIGDSPGLLVGVGLSSSSDGSIYAYNSDRLFADFETS